MECGGWLRVIPGRGSGVARGLLCLWLAQCRAGRRAEIGIGALVPACVLTVRLTFVVFPDSYETFPGVCWLVLAGWVVGVVADGVAGGA